MAMEETVEPPENYEVLRYNRAYSITLYPKSFLVKMQNKDLQLTKSLK